MILTGNDKPGGGFISQEVMECSQPGSVSS